MFKTGRNAQQPGELPAEPPAKTNGATNGATSSIANGVAHYQVPIETSTTTRPVSESDALARDLKEGTLSGFVGNGTTLTGEATFRGMLRVDGHLTGRVTSGDGTLIVGTNGKVEADVEVAVATIYGVVHGDITAAKRIEIGRTARVIGNIQTPALTVEQGGILEGNCRMVQQREAATIETDARPAPMPVPPVIPEAHDIVGEDSDIAS